MRLEKPNFCLRCGAGLEIKHLFDADRPICPRCGWIYFADPKVAVEVLVERGDSVLLVQRGNEPQRGFWSVPGGYMDAWEEPARAAERECLEETGVTARVIELMDVISDREFANSADIVIAYRAEWVSGEPVAGDDALQAGFYPRALLPPLAFRSVRVILGLEDG